MSRLNALSALITRHWRRILVTMLPLLLTLPHAADWLPSNYIKRLDELLYDTTLRATMPRTLDERIAIVDIDEKSLAALGHWPWSRDKVAQLVEQIFTQQGAALLGIDIVFAEADTSSGLPVLERLATRELAGQSGFAAQLPLLREQLNYDQQLADVLKQHPVVLGYYFTSDRDGLRSGQLPAPVMDAKELGGRPVRFTSWNGYGANLPVLTQAARSGGFFNSLTSADGVVRSVPLLAEFDEQYYESLSLGMFRLLADRPAVKPGFPASAFLRRDYGSLESVLLQKGDKAIRLPVDNQVSVLVPFRGLGGPKGGSYRYYSASDIVQGKLPAQSLKGKMVLLGTTVPGLMDLRVTPVGDAYPGVEVHANMLSGMLDDTLHVRPDYAMGYEIVMLLLVGLLLGICLPLLSAPRALLFGLTVLGLVLAINGWAYLSLGLVLPIAAIMLTILTAFALNMSYGYFVESKSKRELARLFGSYVPPELVDEMVKDPRRYSMAAQNKELTVMFCDMRGFTKMSETMNPLEVQALLNLVFGRLTQVIRDNNGTIDKYMGDCVMAFWGAPVDLPKHPQMAVRAATLMRLEMDAINQEQSARGQADIGVGIALNTGVMCVGDMGAQNHRQAYTVIGDEVNLCARLEPLSRLYAVDIVVSESTKRRNLHYIWQELDIVQVKGRHQPVRIFTPVGTLDEVGAEKLRELKAWEQALKAYRAGQWDECEMYLLNATRLNANYYLYQLYAQRVHSLRKSPPDPNWSGVLVLDSK